MEVLLYIVIAIILGNLLDKKKPKAKRMPPPTDQSESDIGLNGGQASLPRGLDDDIRYAEEIHIDTNMPDASYKPQKNHNSNTSVVASDSTADKLAESPLAMGESISLSQAIVLSEILGKPKAKQIIKKRTM